MDITFFSNGATMAFQNGQQVPEAQRGWFLIFVEFLEKQGIDPTQQIFLLPNGAQAKVFRTEAGFNWEMQGGR
jgi:hypothetical protein